MAREGTAEKLVREFERKAGGEPIIAAVLSQYFDDRDDPQFPTSVMSWSEACEYIRIADGEYDAPRPLAWTATKGADASYARNERHGRSLVHYRAEKPGGA